MTAEELLKELEDIRDTGGDEEVDHVRADDLLLQYMMMFAGDLGEIICKTFHQIDKWYA